MIEFKAITNLKAAVVGAVFLTALSGLVPESAEATIPIPGINYSAHHTHPDSDSGSTAVDPPPGTFFDGRFTLRHNRERVFPINEFGWFGAFSNQPNNPFLDTGNGTFADADIPANLLPPNENLNVSVCTVQFIDFSQGESRNLEPITECDGKFFNPFVGLPFPDDEFTPSFNPQELFPDDDFFAVNFDFGEEGLTLETKESFNFFGFSYEFNQEAFEDKVVGISLVESGTGDIGLVPLEGFNIINCIPQGSPESDVATDRCGELSTPLDVQYVTDAAILADSNNQGFVYDSTEKEGTLSNGNPFQLFDDSFLVRETVNEPHNDLGLLALGAFGANLILKCRRKHQHSS